MHVQFSGRYRLKVYHGDTDLLLQDTGWFNNLITDNGLNLLGLGFSEKCFVGSDASAPSEGDTSITNVLGTSTSTSVLSSGKQLSVEPYYSYQQTNFTFDIGAIQGTISQVAIGSTTTNLFSKALLTNTSGTPTTLTLGGIDRLVLTYELRLCINTSDVTGSISVNGATYNFTGRPCDIDYFYFWNVDLGSIIGDAPGYYADTTIHSCLYYNATQLGTVFERPNGTPVTCYDRGADAYVTGSYRRSMWDLWNTSSGNLTNITAFRVQRVRADQGPRPNGGGSWQFLLDAGITKTQYQNFRLEWEYTWGRCA